MTDNFKYSEAYYFMDGRRVDFHVDDIQDQAELHRIRGLALRSSVFSIDGVALELVNMRQNNPDQANYMRRKDRLKSDFEANVREATTCRELTDIHRRLQRSILRKLERATANKGSLEIVTNYFEGKEKPIKKTLCKVSDYQWGLQVTRFLPGSHYARNDVSGRSNNLGHRNREPDIVFEVVNTVVPEQLVFDGLVQVSSVTPLLVAFFPVPKDGNVTANQFVKTYGEHKIRVTHYIWDGAYWKNGRKVEPRGKLSVYEQFTFDMNNARQPRPAALSKPKAEKLKIG